MSDLKNDASTEIDRRVKQFAIDMSKSATEILKRMAEKQAGSGGAASQKNSYAGQKVVISLSNNKVNGFRTPAEQAAQVVAKASQQCWSAHMADKARDVVMLVGGKSVGNPQQVFGTKFAEFTTAWGMNMKKNGLLNHRDKEGWGAGDGYHLQLPHSNLPRAEARSLACLQEYVFLTRKKGKPINQGFEDRYKALLKPLVDAAGKAG